MTIDSTSLTNSTGFSNNLRRHLLVRVGLHCILILSTGVTIWWVAISDGPLGVAGEWTWHRSLPPNFPSPRWLPAIVASLGFFVFAIIGYLASAGKWRWAGIVLLPLAIFFGAILQFSFLSLPSPPAGMERWAVSLDSKYSSGYFLEATRIQDTSTFLTNYEAWVAAGDSFHLGTHPPGLILFSRFILDQMQANPSLAEFLHQNTPDRLMAGFSIVEDRGSVERAAVVAISAITGLASLLTAVPLYWLCRIGAPREDAWLASICWLASPACSLFLPLGDSLYPILTVTILWLVTAAHWTRFPILAILAGVVLWIGMMLSLAFLVVGVVALTSATFLGWREGRRLEPFVLGISLFAGMALPTAWLLESFDLNMMNVWQTNLAKHAGFYEAMPRSYWPWFFVNPVEFAVICGPAALLLAATFAIRHGLRTGGPPVDRVILAGMATVLFLDLSGRNLGEVARLWLFLTPIAMAGAGRCVGALNAARSRPPSLATTVIACQLAMTLVLAACVEPLLPVNLRELLEMAAAR